MKSIYKIMFSISLIVVIVATVILLTVGLKFGVDFKGGSLLELSFSENRPNQGELVEFLDSIEFISGLSVQLGGEDKVVLRFSEINEEQHQQLLVGLDSKFSSSGSIFVENKFDSIGPVIGEELKDKSRTALIVVFLAIVAYIAFAFRKLRSVLSPWLLGGAALIALFHDVIITAGVFSILGKYSGVEITAVFLAAALTILGYSVADSVVVFDRIRENVIKFGRDDFGKLIHKSVIQTLRRSFYTSLTTVFPLFAIYFFGGGSIKLFALALIIGILLGTYSSIFVAIPLVYWWSKKYRG